MSDLDEIVTETMERWGEDEVDKYVGASTAH